MRLKIYAKIIFGHCLCFWLSLSSVIYRPVHLFNTSCGLKVFIKKGLIKKLFRGKSSGTVVYFYFGHASLKREKTLSLNSHFFATIKTIVMSVNKKLS